MKGRVYQPQSAAAKMGKEAEADRRQRRARPSEADSGRASKRVKVDDEAESDSDNESGDEERLAPATDSDSETSDDEDAQGHRSTALPRPPAAPARPPSSSPSASRSTKSSPSASAAFLRPTVTIALPGSIIANAQSAELRTYLAGQIARAAAVFAVDSIVVFRDSPTETTHTAPAASASAGGTTSDLSGEFRGAHRQLDPSAFLARICQYLECPQYLRKHLFPVHRDLQYAGLLNPLDAPHHVREREHSRYREAVVVNRPASGGCWVNAGIGQQDVLLDRPLPKSTRVTVDMLDDHTRRTSASSATKLRGKAVSVDSVRDGGQYWGYDVHLCASFADVFTSCPYTADGRYDLTIGTSDRGRDVQSGGPAGDAGFRLPRYRHMVVVFGGLNGLEECVASDERIKSGKVEELFDLYINTCVRQGSRTIRTEEAVLITLSLLRSHVLHNETLWKGKS